MKTFVKSLLCALALSTTVAFAHPTEEKKTQAFEANAYVSADNNIRLAIKKNVPTLVAVTLRDTQGNVVYQINLPKKTMNYAAKLNLGELNDGDYQLEVMAGEERMVKNLTVNSVKVTPERVITVQ